MSRLPSRIVTLVALALIGPACYVTSAAPRARLAARSAPLPISVLLCETSPDTALVHVLDTALFQRVTRDPAVPVDLVASVRTVGRKDRTLLSFGLYLWTLGVIPWVTSGQRDVEVVFRRPGAGVPSCDAPAAASDTVRAAATGGEGLAIRASGSMVSVLGWGALLLQPMPWWSSDDVNIEAAPAEESRNLPERIREKLSRAVLARAAELRSLAGR